MEEQKQNLVFLEINKADAPRIKMVTEAGIIGKIGLNEHGVGVCLNAIKAAGCDPRRLPVHLALRTVLECLSTNKAIRNLEDVGLASSAHILVADKDKAIGMESTMKSMRLIDMDK